MARKTSSRKQSNDVSTETTNQAQETPQAASTSEATETATTAGGAGTVNDLRFKSTNKSGKTASYNIPGILGGVRVAKSAITNPEFPATFAELSFKAPDADRQAKMAAKAERKAKSQESAAERAAKLEARIAKAQANIEKNKARMEKVRAKLQPKSAQEQTEAAAAGSTADQPEAETVGAAE